MERKLNSMLLLVTALAGTRDLGLEVYIALTNVNLHQSVDASLCVAFIAIFADRFINAAAMEKSRRLVL